MQKKNVRQIGKNSGGIDKERVLETTVKDLKTGQEISRSAASYTTGHPKNPSKSSVGAVSPSKKATPIPTTPTNINGGGAAGPVQRMTNQLASKQYEQQQNKKNKVGLNKKG